MYPNRSRWHGRRALSDGKYSATVVPSNGRYLFAVVKSYLPSILSTILTLGGFAFCCQAMEETLGMTAVVCDELLARGKKAYLRRLVQEEGRDARDDPIAARELRECSDRLGISLR